MSLPRSFQTLVLALAVSAAAVGALAVMALTGREARTALTASVQDGAAGAMDTALRGVENQYRNLVFFKDYALERYKARLRDVTGLAVAVLDRHGSAPAEALEAMGSLRYGDHDYFYAYDSRGVAVAHADPDMIGRDMNHVLDEDGRPLLRFMLDTARTEGEGFDTVLWHRLGSRKQTRKLLYFRWYEPLELLVGTGVYIDDIDADAEAMRLAILEALRRGIGRARDNGHFWLFDTTGRILVHPALEGGDTAALPLPDVAALAALRAAAGTPDTALRHAWGDPARPTRSLVRHFEPLDWYLVFSVDEDHMLAPVRAILSRQALSTAGVVLVAALAAALLAGALARPLARLGRHARELAGHGFHPPPEETLALAGIAFPAEAADLAGALAAMEERLGEYLQELQRTTAARERMASELRIARDIQMDMLPHNPGPPPGDGRAVVSGRLEPAREVGGDFYDAFMVSGDLLAVVVADVSDKGVPAALLMAKSAALLRSETRLACADLPDPDPGRILEAVNRELVRGNAMCMFVTVFLGLLDLGDGALSFAGAGHLPPHVVSAKGARALNLAPAKPLGVSAKAAYGAGRDRLEPGEVLLACTDGVMEAETPEGEFFGAKRLETLLAGQAGSGANGLAKAVFQAASDFGRGHAADDITVLAVEFLGRA